MRHGVVAIGVAWTLGVLLAGCPSNKDGQFIAPTPPPSSKPLTAEQTLLRQKLQQDGVRPEETTFSLHLLQKTAAVQPNGNTFLSPFSVSQVILLAANGATGKLQQGFLQTLGLPAGDISSINAEKRELLALLEPAWEKKAPLYEWTTANAIWSHVPPKPFYIEICGTQYNAQANPLTTADAINQWANEKTRGRIPEIVQSNDVAGNDLILTNAVYFKGRWEDPFDISETADRPFHLPDGATRQQPLMHRDSHGILWYQGRNYAAISLPYEGGVSMVLLLSNADVTAPKLLASLSAKEWQTMHDSMTHAWVDILVPRFQIKTTAELLPLLKEMGMPTEGNFPAIADSFEKTKITRVIQKTFLRVDENGTEAAAVTGMGMVTSAAPPMMEKRLFHVDRPFLCAIVHDKTGTVLFSGVINDPGLVK